MNVPTIDQTVNSKYNPTVLLFFLLIAKIIPLYFFIFLGYLSAKFLGVQKEPIGKLLLYIISPAVVFYSGLTNSLTLENISLPVIIFLVATLVSSVFYYLGKKLYPEDNSGNLLAYCAGAGNTGYFGLPVIAAVVGEQAFSLAVIAGLGMIAFESTFGFYYAAKGNFSTVKSLQKLASLPHLYAFALGSIFHYLGYISNQTVDSNFAYFKGSYSLLGMMIIGIGLANLKFTISDFKFVGLVLSAKFLICPLLMGCYLYLDSQYFHLYSDVSRQILLIMGIVPLAANAVVIASELKLSAEKAALAVLISTFCALLLIPAWVG